MLRPVTPDMSRQSFDFAVLASACMQAVPEPGHTQLLQQLRTALPQLEFKLVLTRSGWYRIGGVVDKDGESVSEDLAAWVETESEGDVLNLYHKYVGKKLYATRLCGKTCYFVARTGDLPQEFIQLEVEEVEEVLDRPIFTADTEDDLPDVIEELVDPAEYQRLEPTPVKPPRYIFRRIIPIADYLDRSVEETDSKLPIIRFMQDWQRSSAGESAPFCHHWVLAFREYIDGYGEPRFHVKPITTYTDDIPVIDDNVPRGTELANLIHGFDRQTGYPMAWYFFMLTHKQVSHQIAESIHKDLMGAYAYLPARDVKVLQDWYDRGYGV